MRRRSLVSFALISVLACACTAIIGLPDLPAEPDGGLESGTFDGPSHESSVDSPAGSADTGGAADSGHDVEASGADAEGGSADAPAETTGETGSTDSPQEAPVTATIPSFNPTSETQNDDFLVTLSSDANATICYRLDGQSPSCSGGLCVGASQTYNGALQIPVNGTLTDINTGQVTVTAIACAAGETTSLEVSQIYALQVAAPTMTNPPPAVNIPYQVLEPTIQTQTVSSTTPVDAVAIWVTTSGSVPTCTTGTQVASPTTFGAGGPIGALIGNTTYRAIGCKQGYLASNTVSLPYTVQLHVPALPPGNTTLPVTLTQASYDTANQGSGDWVCSTSNATQPQCGSAGACSTGAVWPTTISSAVTVNAVACGTNLVASVVASVTY